MMNVIVIGGGAAGCFAAIEIARRHPDAAVTLLEAGPKLLAKVALTGGGRCNLTNSFAGVDDLRKVYPRGHQLMKRVLRQFSNEDTMRWFENEGVRLAIQDDECVFPVSQDAMQIVRTLERLLRQSGVTVLLGRKVSYVRAADIDAAGDNHDSPAGARYFEVQLSDGQVLNPDRVLVTTGGSPRQEGLGFLRPLNLETVPPVPSLFTMRVDDEGLRKLGGTLAEVSLGLAGTPFRAGGTLLLTDWGISGPAALKLSSYAARYLADNQYRGTLLVDWMPSVHDAEIYFKDMLKAHPQKLLTSVHPEGITSRLWEHLTAKAGLRRDIRSSELGSKGLARLSSIIKASEYQLAGRVHFKEEFVTAGGVALSEINLSTMESRRLRGLFFAGEVLDVDAVTGGFNLQAAWSMAAVAAINI